MINGAHIILYTTDPEADRAFFRDVLNFSSVDAGHGWLIFALPPAEAAFHDLDKHDLGKQDLDKHDLDKQAVEHNDASTTVTTFCFSQTPPNPPVDGGLLQVMPWPNFKDLTDHEIRAIYEYLKAVPCIQGNYPGPRGPAANIPPEPADRCSD